MKFLADECCDADMIVSLREDGHDILYIITESKQGFWRTCFSLEKTNKGHCLTAL